MRIVPHILGSGFAGKAVQRSLLILATLEDEFKVATPKFIKRGLPLVDIVKDSNAKHILIIANPDGLHTDTLIEANNAGFDAIICEKPSSTDSGQLEKLKNTNIDAAILHVYRQLWGPQTIKSMIEGGELGDIVAIENKLWQASKSVFLTPDSITKPVKTWRSDINLTGKHGVSLGLGTHLLDLTLFLSGKEVKVTHSHVNNTHGSHDGDDTYYNISLASEKGTYISCSISNMVHGTKNDLEVNIIGSQGTVSWSFLQPDELIVARGYNKKLVYRNISELGSLQPAFHGLGWIEGYIEILRQVCREVAGLSYQPYPSLKESNNVLELLLSTIK